MGNPIPGIRRGLPPQRILLLLAAVAALGPPTSLVMAGRESLQGDRRTLRGRAIVTSVDIDFKQPSEQVLFVHTEQKERVHVFSTTEQKTYPGLTTGMGVEIDGVWLSRGRGGLRTPVGNDRTIDHKAFHTAAATSGGTDDTVSAAGWLPYARATYCFMGAGAITATSGQRKSQPRITRGVSSMVHSTSVDAAGAGDVVRAAALIYNPTTEFNNVSTLVIPIAALNADGTACPGTELPRFTEAEVKKAVFASQNPTGPTLGQYFRGCSYGRSFLNETNSLVAPLVKLPCSGVSALYGVTWSTNKCDFDDFNGWADAAEEILGKTIDLSKYKYRVYLLPPGPCKWVGLGYIGCDGSPGFECRSWIGANHWATPSAIAHGIWDTLPPSQEPILTNGDKTGVMGYCCTDRCPNTPHTWQLGWAALEQFDGKVLSPGKSVTVRIAALGKTPSLGQCAGVRVVTNWTAAAATQAPVYVGYRTVSSPKGPGGDVGLELTARGKVHVYQSNCTGTYDSQKSLYRAGLAKLERWEQPGTGLVVMHRFSGNQEATVTLCVKTPETLASCTAKPPKDNDCNGLAGTAEPACKRFIRKARKVRG